jgi:hypothetical protein
MLCQLLVDSESVSGLILCAVTRISRGIVAYQSAVSVDVCQLLVDVVWGFGLQGRHRPRPGHMLGYRVVIDLALDIDFVSAGIQRHGNEDDEVCVRTQGS